jgi:hypothetical protein
VSHLQFADDTLIAGEASMDNILSIKQMLILFELISGLKVNFNKSMLFACNVPDGWFDLASNVLQCKSGAFPFVYLGLPVGGDPRKTVLWDPVIATIKSYLESWKSRSLSFGGRVVLLNSVLSSLPVYYFSFFKAPSGTISTLETLFKSFLWGEGEGVRKVHWVKWETVCHPKDSGGLGVKDLNAFNLAFLGKWVWRINMDRNSFWVRV